MTDTKQQDIQQITAHVQEILKIVSRYNVPQTPAERATYQVLIKLEEASAWAWNAMNTPVPAKKEEKPAEEKSVIVEK